MLWLSLALKLGFHPSLFTTLGLGAIMNTVSDGVVSGVI
jgi:hypothetical protein